MTEEQLIKAIEVHEKLRSINGEIECWEKTEKSGNWMPHDNVPWQMFDDYKNACISEINKKKTELEKEFSEI